MALAPLKKPLLTLIATLGFALQANADLITLDPSFNYSYVGSNVSVPIPSSDFEIDRPTRIPAKGETSAVIADASSFSTYKFTEAGASGSWTGVITNPSSGFAASQTLFGFIPTVDLRYQIEGIYENFPTTSGISANFTSRIATEGGNRFIFNSEVGSHPSFLLLPSVVHLSYGSLRLRRSRLARRRPAADSTLRDIWHVLHRVAHRPSLVSSFRSVRRLVLLSIGFC